MLVAVQLLVLGLYLPPVFKEAAVGSAPDDHFAAGPDCRVTDSADGRVGGAGGCPTVGAGIISARRCSNTCRRRSAPDDHFAAGPDCRVIPFVRQARWWCWWLSNCRCWDCICRRCLTGRSRHFRPRRSFRCRSRLPCDRFGQRARWWCWWLSKCRCWDCISRRCSNSCRSYPPQTIISLPVQTAVWPFVRAGALVMLVAVQLSVLGLYLPPVFKVGAHSAPDDHFAAGPDCCVTGFGQRARWWCWWLSNCRCRDCISRRC